VLADEGGFYQSVFADLFNLVDEQIFRVLYALLYWGLDDTNYRFAFRSFANLIR
jgi:hypothetical protein